VDGGRAVPWIEGKIVASALLERRAELSLSSSVEVLLHEAGQLGYCRSLSGVPDDGAQGFSDAFFIHAARFVSADGVDGSTFTWDRSIDARSFQT
jgi:hypothetical protein